MLAMKWGNLDGNTYNVTENLRRDNSFGAPKTKSSKASVKISPPWSRHYGRSGSAWSLMIARREGVKAVQRQMRHKSAMMTLDVYGHLYPEDHAEAVDRFDKQIRLASI